ncbi:MAG: hypothetical protein LUC43_07205 [Burkholderiales bacterium]|nr:hypothetical protein [Burkholderiales bacterium]
MEPGKNQYGQKIMQKELCELLSRAFERYDWEGPSLAVDVSYPCKAKPENLQQELAPCTCVAIQPNRDAADIMLAVGAANSFATPPGIAEELASFMEERVESEAPEKKTVEHVKANGKLMDIPPLLIFPNFVWNPDVAVPPPVLEKLKP